MSQPVQPPSFVSGAEPCSLILPLPGTLFAKRAQRLHELADDGALAADWLRFVAGLAGTQARIQAELAGEIEAADGLDEDGRLDLAGLPRLAVWHRAFELLADAAVAGAASGLGNVSGIAPAEREAIALRLLAGETQPGDLTCAPLAAAALELVATVAAVAAFPTGMTSIDEVCPVCGSHAVASTLADEASGKRRYLHCGWCNTAWHHMRAQCTHCHSSRDVAYQSLDEGRQEAGQEREADTGAAWRAETCDDCHTYLKVFDRSKAKAADPVADDLASLELDFALGEAGYQRPAANPYLALASGGEPA